MIILRRYGTPTVSLSFLDLTDTSNEYEENKYLRFTASGVEAAVVQTVAGFPKYYIEPDSNISVNAYGQYTINETGYIEVAGSLELDEGAMLIVQRRTVGYIT